MKTPIPVQLEQWIKTVENKKSPYDLREISILHLRNVRDIIDKVIRENTREPSKNNTMIKDWKKKQ
jgi:hypothetical protein